MRITPQAALEVASEEYRSTASALGKPAWPVLIETSARTAGQLGISQRAWGQACHLLGRERAALCVLVIDRNVRLRTGHRFAARHPARCLAGMLRRSFEGGFNLQGMLMAFQKEPEAPSAPQLEAPPIAEPADGPLASLTSQILARTARLMGEHA